MWALCDCTHTFPVICSCLNLVSCYWRLFVNLLWGGFVLEFKIVFSKAKLTRGVQRNLNHLRCYKTISTSFAEETLFGHLHEYGFELYRLQ